MAAVVMVHGSFDVDDDGDRVHDPEPYLSSARTGHAVARALGS